MEISSRTSSRDQLQWRDQESALAAVIHHYITCSAVNSMVMENNTTTLAADNHRPCGRRL